MPKLKNTGSYYSNAQGLVIPEGESVEIGEGPGQVSAKDSERMLEQYPDHFQFIDEKKAKGK